MTDSKRKTIETGPQAWEFYLNKYVILSEHIYYVQNKRKRW